MALIDCYMPVFVKVLEVTSKPEIYFDYEQTRLCIISQLEKATLAACLDDIYEEERLSARFAVIVWVDEAIMCSTLSWRKSWKKELLQREYLNTTIGGELFFSKLSGLLSNYIQAREVFLFCLQNGFHGRYSASSEYSELQNIILQQRRLCLPEKWHVWPNNAIITPGNTKRKDARKLKLSPVFFMTLALLLLYVALFIILLYH
ncbi:DotU family type IV/VI secretion system protein [Salmonella enterica subsp. enterica]|nr:DotU family type IV/VI secretion system protein [Salmonella enterica subsp. enterica serovar Mikawasima]EJQ8143237.1 DotU family type IV/VI secretion system protein [Salmonella enterica]MIO70022.1 DotU family type IV/VI secretion system protein [Salmonella enterica subsp. enterica serovar Mikawasima]